MPGAAVAEGVGDGFEEDAVAGKGGLGLEPGAAVPSDAFGLEGDVGLLAAGLGGGEGGIREIERFRTRGDAQTDEGIARLGETVLDHLAGGGELGAGFLGITREVVGDGGELVADSGEALGKGVVQLAGDAVALFEGGVRLDLFGDEGGLLFDAAVQGKEPGEEEESARGEDEDGGPETRRRPPRRHGEHFDIIDPPQGDGDGSHFSALVGVDALHAADAQLGTLRRQHLAEPRRDAGGHERFVHLQVDEPAPFLDEFSGEADELEGVVAGERGGILDGLRRRFAGLGRQHRRIAQTDEVALRLGQTREGDGLAHGDGHRIQRGDAGPVFARLDDEAGGTFDESDGAAGLDEPLAGAPGVPASDLVEPHGLGLRRSFNDGDVVVFRADEVGADALALVVEEGITAALQAHPRAHVAFEAGHVEVLVRVAEADHEFALAGDEQPRPFALRFPERHIDEEPLDLDPAVVAQSGLHEIGPEIQRFGGLPPPGFLQFIDDDIRAVKAARDVAGDLDLVPDAGQLVEGILEKDASRVVLPVEAVGEVRDDGDAQSHRRGETRLLVGQPADVGDVPQRAHGDGRIVGGEPDRGEQAERPCRKSRHRREL